MSVKIRRYKNGRFTDEIWRGTLTAAQDTFCKRVRDGTLDRVEIRNVADELIFTYPLEAQLTTLGH